MDLLSSIRKSGSRGGVNFSWDEVQTSQHRENYLGHSLMAPVGRWQKNRDLSWYAKGDGKNAVDGETEEERKVRERKEEIRKIKEAEEDALSRALGLPVADRNVTGSNAISVGEVNKVVKEQKIGEDEEEDTAGLGKSEGFGKFVGRVQDGAQDSGFVMAQEGGLMGKDRKREARSRSRERKPRRHRHRSRSGNRSHRSHRDRSGERHRHRRRHEDREDRRPRSRSGERRERRYRSRSPDRNESRDKKDREERNERRPRRSRSLARESKWDRDDRR